MSNGEVKYSLLADSAGLITGFNQGLEALGKFKNYAREVIDVVGREWGKMAGLADMSKAVRMASGEIYQLKHALDVAVGSDSGIFQMFRFLNTAMADFRDGGEESTRIFKSLGLTVAELDQLGGIERLLLVLDRLKSLDDQSVTVAARTLFGRSVEDVLILSEKTDEIRANMERFAGPAEHMNQAAERANELLDNWVLFKKEIGLVAEEFATQLLPSMGEASRLASEMRVRGVGEAVGGWANDLIAPMVRLSGNAMKAMEEGDLQKSVANHMAMFTRFSPFGPLMSMLGNRTQPGAAWNDAVTQIQSEGIAAQARGIIDLVTGPFRIGMGRRGLLDTDTKDSQSTQREAMHFAPGNLESDPMTRIGGMWFNHATGTPNEHAAQTAQHTQRTAEFSKQTVAAVEKLDQDIVNFVADMEALLKNK